MISSDLSKRRATTYAVGVVVVMSAIGWSNEHDSCLRQSGVRASARLVAETAAKARTKDAEESEKDGDMPAAKDYRRLAAIYTEAARKARPLECGGLMPNTE